MSEDIEIINQNTRIEKIKNFFSNNYKKLIGGLIIILLFLFSYFGYLEYKKRQKAEIAEIYNQITLKNIIDGFNQFIKYRQYSKNGNTINNSSVNLYT